MKKTVWILVFVYSSFMLLCSCDPEGETEEITASKSHWKLKSTEFWGVRPVNGAKLEQFTSFPFNVTYNFTTHANITYTGQEGNITRTDVDPLLNTTISLIFTWSKLPDSILPDTPYKITYESKGTAGNGIGISVPAYYNAGYQWNTLSIRNGPVTANLLMSKPDSDPNHQKMKIGVNMSSGSSYYMEWVYVYEWTP